MKYELIKNNNGTITQCENNADGGNIYAQREEINKKAIANLARPTPGKLGNLSNLQLFNFGLDWVVRQTHKIGIDKTTAWSMGYDGTVRSTGTERNPCELTSNPIKYSDLENVKKVIDFLNLNGASVNSSCGFHCHIDAKDLTLAEVKKVLVTYLIYEEVIAFTQPSSRRWSSQWCSSVRNNGNVNGSSSSLDSAFHNATTNDLITKIKKAKTFKDLFFVFNVYDPRYLKCNIKTVYL